MFQRRESYRYSLLGLLLCRLQIPFDAPDRYFCSQFVGTVLAESGAAELPKPASCTVSIETTGNISFGWVVGFRRTAAGWICT